jgi:hypothetical protein
MKKFSLLLATIILFSACLFSQTQLSFRFSNPYVVSGTPDVFQFDIDVKADAAGTFQRDLQVYLDYNTLAFGTDIIANGKVSVSTLDLMADHYQIVNITDNTDAKIAVITEATEELNQNGGAAYFNEVETEWSGLLRFQIEIADANELTGIAFDEALMNGGQYMQDLSSTDPVSYFNPSLYENIISNINLVGQDIQFTTGWAGISSYMLPVDTDIEYLFDPIVNELIILKNFYGAYLPSMETNTLVDWDNNSGYMVKVSNDCQLKILGNNYGVSNLTLSAGWTLIPVLSSCDVDTEALFSSILASVIIIQEVAGTDLYWPSMGISTLPVLKPGKAYFVKMSAEETINFPVCN